jgi:hypothetical protein
MTRAAPGPVNNRGTKREELIDGSPNVSERTPLCGFRRFARASAYKSMNASRRRPRACPQITNNCANLLIPGMVVINHNVRYTYDSRIACVNAAQREPLRYTGAAGPVTWH